MTLDELDELLEKPKADLTVFPLKYRLKCRRCHTEIMALYHSNCGVCNAPRFDVEILEVNGQKHEGNSVLATLYVPNEAADLKSDLPPEVTKDGMTVVGYLQAMKVGTSAEFIALMRNNKPAWDQLVLLAKAEMRAKGIKIIGRNA